MFGVEDGALGPAVAAGFAPGFLVGIFDGFCGWDWFVLLFVFAVVVVAAAELSLVVVVAAGVEAGALAVVVSAILGPSVWGISELSLKKNSIYTRNKEQMDENWQTACVVCEVDGRES